MTGGATAAGSMFGPWGTVIGAGADLFGALWGAHSQSKANKEALAFEKSAAQNAFYNNEVARRGNYDQWAARERRLGTIGQMLGYGAREIPAYMPGVNPWYTPQTLVQRVEMSRPGSIGSYL